MLDAVDRLRRAADEQHRTSRTVRLGTVFAATVPLLVPAVREFHALHPATEVEVIAAQQSVIHRSLLEGGVDLGLVNYLEGDDLAPDLHTTELLRGRPVVCLRPDSPLAGLESVGVDDLLSEPLIVMRSGYLMHRFTHRLLKGRTPSFSYSADGAEMGKLMVAEGLGVTVLPDYSVIGDPLERTGAITARPLKDDTTTVLLVVQRSRSGSVTRAARDLHRIFVERAEAHRDGARGRGQDAGER
ncbi:LysR family transcriptional regulator [Streptomyces sp. KAI-26]|nr:LysR family transcriptional regulator [Streptomyces sp. CAI-24]NUV78424.1 LysR family transcriptional regulator [Streptomyces sp. CAI-155]NUV90234.1 LysR family transcriptional regulator [Streptomyces sp. KAI-26]NUW24474.1 LysR family transcriptional regulator [Streptomyces roseoviolaceus]